MDFPPATADLGHTRLDLDRHRRRGVPEAVFGQGKTPAQILDIAARLAAAGQTVVCTRVSPEAAAEICGARPDFEYSPVARVLHKQGAALPVSSPAQAFRPIAVVTAGTTDIPVAEEAALCLELWGDTVIRHYDVGVAGLHRLLAIVPDLRRAGVIVCAAGMEAALPSVVAGLVAAPVVAVPTSVGYGASFGGVAALLGMLNSCSGGVAVVNIDNGFGAALLARMILRAGAPAAEDDPPAGCNPEP